MKPTTITPGQIFFRQLNNSSVDFALVLDVQGSEVIYTNVRAVPVEGTRTAMSVEVKPNPEDKIIKIFKAREEWVYNEFMGCIFEGSACYTIPPYELLTKETITLHDRD